MINDLKLAQPDWVKSAVDDTISSLRLIQEGRLPAVLVPFFMRTSALRLLRCVYGSDAATVDGIREHIMENEEMERAVRAKLAAR